jgi:branched-subunit amino acid ABC-type transport system permease component
MEVFTQQLINGIALGSIYGLIAIGYTMVYGIVGMINFAHGDIFMIGGFIALISFLILVSFGLTVVPVILLIVLLVSMAITALYGWTVERIAYRPLRHSFRLAPMLSAIGMSFVLTNYSQVAQGARVKPVPPIITGGYTLHEGAGGFVVQLSNIQIIVVVTTVVLLALFTWLVARTRLGRDMRACEQDQTMAALLGVDVDRTISHDSSSAQRSPRSRHDVPALLRASGFLHGLRRGHQGLHRRRVRRHRLAARRDAGRACDRPDRDAVVGVFFGRIQGCRRVLDPDRRADLHADRPPGPSRSRKSLMGGVTTPAPKATAVSWGPGAAFIFKKALISALVALVLFSLMIGVRTEAGPSGQLIYWTRFGDLAAMVATVFGGSIIVELLRQWWGPVGTVRIVPQPVQSALATAGRWIAPVLLVFTFLVPVIFYNERTSSTPAFWC